MSQIQTLPQLIIELDGVALAVEDSRALWEVRVQQRLSLPTLCELTFLEPTDTFIEDATLASGSALRISDSGHEEALFNGQVTAVEFVYEPSRGREVRVRGYDPLHRLRKRQQVRARVQVTLIDVMRELLADLGIAIEAAETGPLWQRLIQFQQSDFDMLADLAERCGLYFTLRDETLHVLTLEGAGEEVALTSGESLLEARIEVNSDRICRTVTTAGWNPLRVEQHEGKAHDARVGRDVAAEVSPDEVGGTGERMLLDQNVQDDHQAEALAQAELDARVAQEVTLWGVAEGQPRLRPGVRVRVQGIAPALEGVYVLTAVDHICDGVKGFVSVISTAPPAPRPRHHEATAALGIVTHVNDPESFGRVQVKLPTFNDVETDWMSVLLAGAGAGKGMVTLPDVGDAVLVLFPHGDPAQGVVLGGLYGSQTPAGWDWGVEGAAVQRYTFLTPGGQRVQLDDARKAIRLENSDGSYFELSPDGITMHGQNDLRIEAPGRNILIKGQRIDFERG